jgi:hypothetical protein
VVPGASPPRGKEALDAATELVRVQAGGVFDGELVHPETRLAEINVAPAVGEVDVPREAMAAVDAE